MSLGDWSLIHSYIIQLEQDGIVTRTFRRLDPDRQQVVILAILDEAIEKGPAAINIKHVARRAGVSVGSLYTYFEDRDNLLGFVVTLCVRLLTDSLDSFRPHLVALPLREALRAYLLGGIEWSRVYAGMLRLFARAAYQGEPELSENLVRPIATVLRELVQDILIQAVERGEVRSDLDLDTVTRLVHALTIAAADSQLLPYLNSYFQITGDSDNPEQTTEVLIDFILNGIGTASQGNT